MTSKNVLWIGKQVYKGNLLLFFLGTVITSTQGYFENDGKHFKKKILR